MSIESGFIKRAKEHGMLEYQARKLFKLANPGFAVGGMPAAPTPAPIPTPTPTPSPTPAPARTINLGKAGMGMVTQEQYNQYMGNPAPQPGLWDQIKQMPGDLFRSLKPTQAGGGPMHSATTPTQEMPSILKNYEAGAPAIGGGASWLRQ